MREMMKVTIMSSAAFVLSEFQNHQYTIEILIYANIEAIKIDFEREGVKDLENTLSENANRCNYKRSSTRAIASHQANFANHNGLR